MGMTQSQLPLDPKQLVKSLWSEEHLPDLRLFTRLVLVVQTMVTKLQDVAVGLRRALRRGSTRFFNNPRISAKILWVQARSHLLAPLLPLNQILVAHDSSEIDQHGRDCPDDAGPLRSPNARGYMTHWSVACSPDGLIHGALQAWAWKRSWELRNQDHGKRSMNDKESSKWDKGIGRSERVLRELGFQGSCRHVEDREADIFEHLVHQKEKRRSLVVRCDLSRNPTVWVKGKKVPLQEHLAEQPVVWQETISVDSRTRNRAKGLQHKERQATLAFRYCTVQRCAPKNYKNAKYTKQGLELGVVEVREIDAPADVEPLHWILWSVEAVKTLEQALQVRQDYRGRWGVEEYFFVCKTGCGLETEHVDSLASFERLMVVVMVVASHLLTWVNASALTPTQKANELVEPQTIDAIKQACSYHRIDWPRGRLSIQSLVLVLAKLGGYEPRPDRTFGWRVVWTGWQRVQQYRDIVDFDRAARGNQIRRKNNKDSVPPEGPVPAFLPPKLICGPT